MSGRRILIYFICLLLFTVTFAATHKHKTQSAKKNINNHCLELVKDLSQSEDDSGKKLEVDKNYNQFLQGLCSCVDSKSKTKGLKQLNEQQYFDFLKECQTTQI